MMMMTTTKLSTNDNNKDEYHFLFPHNHCNDESQLIVESSSSSSSSSSSIIPLCKRRMRYSKEPLPVQIIHVLVLVLALQLCTAPIQLIDAFCSVGYPTRKCSSYIQYNNRHCHNMFTPIRNNDIDNNDEDENPIENISTSSMTTTTTTTTTTTNQTNDSSPKQSLDLLKQQQLMEKEQQQKQEQLELEQPIPPMTDPFQATGQNELFKTLAGGPALIFEMARKLVKDSDYNIRTTTSTIQYTTTPLSSETRQQQSQSQSQQRRWYPHSGISDVNPSFRTQSPAMNNQGFCKSIWRNVRKRNKPSLWKLALRTYDRMALLEGDPNFPQIQRSNIHHEGAMQACAKLGLWQRALEIYHYVYQQEMGEIEVINGNINRQQQQPQLEDQQQQKQKQSQSTMTSKNKMQSTLGGGGNNGGKLSTKNNKTNERTKKGSVYVTDDMVLSLVRATVRASRLRSRQKKKSHDPPLSPEQEEREAALRRIPLDTALEILSTLPDDHNIPLVAYYFNPLAAAYQSLGYTKISKEILETMLSNRTAGEDETLNVHDLCAKDKGSYSLLVQASVVTGDWGAAVDSLNEMTNAGIYPNPRHCNIWSEISERHTRPRAVGSWKKKRDDYWTESIQ